MDIRFNAEYPASMVSNLAPNAFMFDGIACASMEGLVQSFKTRDQVIQIAICRLSGLVARESGQALNEFWMPEQKVWWRGRGYDRHGDEYQEVLDNAYDHLFAQNLEARRALLATGNNTLTHSIGKSDPRKTILTEEEFVSRLLFQRDKYS